MDPALQLILDTMNTRFDELNDRFSVRDREFAACSVAVDLRFDELVASHAAPVATLEERVAGLESIQSRPPSSSGSHRWRPTTLTAAPTTCSASPTLRPFASSTSRTSGTRASPRSSRRPRTWLRGALAWKARWTT